MLGCPCICIPVCLCQRFLCCCVCLRACVLACLLTRMFISYARMHVIVCNFCTSVYLYDWASHDSVSVCLDGCVAGCVYAHVYVLLRVVLCGYKPVFLSHMSFLLIYLWVCTLKYLCACSSMHLSVFTICCMCCARCRMEWLCWLIMWRRRWTRLYTLE